MLFSLHVGKGAKKPIEIPNLDTLLAFIEQYERPVMITPKNLNGYHEIEVLK